MHNSTGHISSSGGIYMVIGTASDYHHLRDSKDYFGREFYKVMLIIPFHSCMNMNGME